MVLPYNLCDRGIQEGGQQEQKRQTRQAKGVVVELANAKRSIQSDLGHVGESAYCLFGASMVIGVGLKYRVMRVCCRHLPEGGACGRRCCIANRLAGLDLSLNLLYRSSTVRYACDVIGRGPGEVVVNAFPGEAAEGFSM